MDETYGGIGEEDLDALAGTLSWAFGFAATDARPWLARAGHENVRVVRRGKNVDACLITIPHAQFFGGESVPAIGIAGVATPPEARGTGAAIALLKATLRELHERGATLSNLYPAALGLYRAVGYENAGACWEVTVSLDALASVGERALPLRAMTEADRPAIEASYREHARATNGWLDRGPYVWQRVHAPRGQTTRGFVVGEGGRVDGHAIFYEKAAPTEHRLYKLVTTSLVARTPAAVRRLLTLFADHGTLGSTVTWFSAPNDAFVHALPTAAYDAKQHFPWMVRIVDVAKALSARGYPAGVASALELEITDDLIGANAGRFVVEIEGGRAEVKRGGRGAMKLDVRALAALYTGHMTPRALVVAGALDAPDADLARAATIFGAPPPTLADFF